MRNNMKSILSLRAEGRTSSRPVLSRFASDRAGLRDYRFITGLAASLVLLSCMTISRVALADTAEDLTKIEAETTVLKATAKKLEVQAQIAGKQAEIDRLSAPPAPANMPYLAAPAGYSDPTIHSIEGIGKARYATLDLGNGTMMDVKVGDVLPNGMRVISIRPNEVIVGAGKKKRVRLAYATQASFQHSGYSSSGAYPLPLPGMIGVAPRGVATR